MNIHQSYQILVQRVSRCLVLRVGEAASVEEITQCSVVKVEPAYGRYEATEYAQREREREAHTKRYNSISNMQQLQNDNNNLYKSLQSHFI